MNIKHTSKNWTVLHGKNIIQDVIEQLSNKNIEGCLKKTLEAQEIFQQVRSSENISICLSLMGLIKYLEDKNKYSKSLIYINDGAYLANYSNNTSAKLINEFALADIDFAEEDFDTAMLHYEKASTYAFVEDEYNLSKLVKERLQQLKDIKMTCGKRDPLIALLKIGQTVVAETDINILLKVITEETKAAIQADRCSVFLYDRANDELWSKVALGMDSQEIRFPAGKGLAGHVVKTGEPINIRDAYNDERFNKDIDIQTGYKTTTILCMPIKNLNHKIIGAFQVLNKADGYFTKDDEDLLVAIGSSAGIALENAQLFKKQQEMLLEQKEVFDSFIDTLAASIDARDKITAGHSARVKLYSEVIARELNLDRKLIEIISKAATLHDIGKIGIRDSVLQKEGKLTEDEYKHIQSHVEITHNILEKIHMSDDFKIVTEIACSHHEKYNGCGYHRKLAGENIHIGGRILAVSDVFDAITSKRHYRDKMPMEKVINILMKDSGSHFDEKIINCFLSISIDKIVEVFLTENNLILKDTHRELLKKYSMMDLYNILSNKSQSELTENQENLVKIFQIYYTTKPNGEDRD